MPKCSATKADGTPCERLIDASAIYCYSHDAKRAEQRSRNAAKAARSKGPVGELCEVKSLLRTIADDVLEGTVDKGRGSIASQILGTWLRAVEVERKVLEQEQLLERLDALEQATQTNGRRPPWGA
jgi:hypothetical protein